MRKLFILAALATALPAFAAYNWTGAVDGYWTNANNWAEGAVPGRIKVPDAMQAGGWCTNGVPTDIAIFGDALSGNAVTTINFDGVYSISNLLTTGKNQQYTYGAAADQFVPIHALGVFSAGETPDTRVAIVAGRLQVGVECSECNYNASTGKYTTKYGGDKVTIRNNSSEEFVLGAWGWRTVGARTPKQIADNITFGAESGVRWEGSGDIRLTQTRTDGINSQTENFMTGRFICDVPYTYRAYNVSAVAGATSTERQIVIGENGVFSHPGGAYNGLTVGGSAPTWIKGEGQFRINTGFHTGEKRWKSSAMSFSAATRFTCPLGGTITSNTSADALNSPCGQVSG
ncbi:MAG: hypothetical protein MJ240_11055 [Kiritimatiellae bacterium]|nr:hypothetical protein [Kiritimatiellia bacterium]